MGCFDFTCSLSGLGIGSGDPVKFFLLTENPYDDNNIVCYLHDLYFPRTWPVRAVYNDYGSIEDYDPQSPAVLGVTEGLKEDLVERGVGDNSCHDVATRKGMSFEETLEALWEGRIQVERELVADREWSKKHRGSFSEPPGLPTLKNVEKTLTDAGFLIKNDDDGYLVDEREYGWARVRGGGYGDRTEDLEKTLPALQKDYAAMITIGTGRYSNTAEIQVMPKAMERKNHIWMLLRDEDTKKPLKVYQAMIRTDVWDALMKLVDWEVIRADVQKVWENTLEDAEFDAKPIPVIQGDDPDSEKVREIISDIKEFKKLRNRFGGSDTLAGSICRQSAIPFAMGLGEHFAIIAARHVAQNFEPQQITDFLDDTAGFVALHRLLYPVRHYWRPSWSCGPQSTDFQAQHAWLQILADVTAKLKKKQAES